MHFILSQYASSDSILGKLLSKVIQSIIQDGYPSVHKSAVSKLIALAYYPNVIILKDLVPLLNHTHIL